MSTMDQTKDTKPKHQYKSYQWEIYGAGLQGKIPTVTTDPNKLQAQAEEKLSVTSYNYVAGGAGEKSTMDANRLAFRQWKVCYPAFISE